MSVLVRLCDVIQVTNHETEERGPKDSQLFFNIQSGLLEAFPNPAERTRASHEDERREAMTILVSDMGSGF